MHQRALRPGPLHRAGAGASGIGGSLLRDRGVGPGESARSQVWRVSSCTASIEMDPPSTPWTGNEIASPGSAAPST